MTKKWTKDEIQVITSHYMLMPMNLWPKSLLTLCQQVSKKYGSSGDVFADTIQMWIQHDYDNEKVLAELEPS